MQVHECLIYDIDAHQIHMFIEELNMPVKIRLTDDARIGEVQFDGETLEMTASIRENDMTLTLKVFDRVKIRVDTT